MKRNLLQLYDGINNILASWNPIGVPDHIASDEYKGYVAQILDALEKKENLMNCLEDILINKIGLEYNPNNKKHLEDLKKVCEKLLSLYKVFPLIV